ncbi:hypothetical protein WR25_23078 [Diploscapter pachys]|uniref:Uncharacterized protein n=1 Tax=Diploscapter pachys TaxID=2018661 RepID=A0A2A2K5Q0_9BILA|nr:hypothetical protein WR25_23078 [Diploscapter pachys]
MTDPDIQSDVSSWPGNELEAYVRPLVTGNFSNTTWASNDYITNDRNNFVNSKINTHNGTLNSLSIRPVDGVDQASDPAQPVKLLGIETIFDSIRGATNTNFPRQTPQNASTNYDQVMAHSALTPDNFPRPQTSNVFDHTIHPSASSSAQMPGSGLVQRPSAPYYANPPSNGSYHTNQPSPSSSVQMPAPGHMQVYRPNDPSPSILNQNSTTEQRPTSSQYGRPLTLGGHDIDTNDPYEQASDDVYERSGIARSIPPPEWLLGYRGYEAYIPQYELERYQAPSIIESNFELPTFSNDHPPNDYSLNFASTNYYQDADMRSALQQENGQVMEQYVSAPSDLSQQGLTAPYYANQPSMPSSVQMQVSKSTQTPNPFDQMDQSPMSSFVHESALEITQRSSAPYYANPPSNGPYHTSQPSTSSFAQMSAPGHMKRPRVPYRIKQPSNAPYHTNQPLTSSSVQMPAPGQMQVYRPNDPSPSTSNQNSTTEQQPTSSQYGRSLLPDGLVLIDFCNIAPFNYKYYEGIQGIPLDIFLDKEGINAGLVTPKILAERLPTGLDRDFCFSFAVRHTDNSHKTLSDDLRWRDGTKAMSTKKYYFDGEKKWCSRIPKAKSAFHKEMKLDSY